MMQFHPSSALFAFVLLSPALAVAQAAGPIADDDVAHDDIPDGEDAVGVADVSEDPTTPAAPATASTPSPLREEQVQAPVYRGPIESFDSPECATSDEPICKRVLHGFRLGYSYFMNGTRPDPDDPDQTVMESIGMETPHSFIVGYEVAYRMVGHSWLNVLVIGNASVGGLEQSKFFPNLNGLLGFEFNESFQLGVGINLTPDKDKASHAILAGGWTPRVGGFYVPVHAYFIPDVDGNHRTGMTVGVTF